MTYKKELNSADMEKVSGGYLPARGNTREFTKLWKSRSQKNKPAFVTISREEIENYQKSNPIPERGVPTHTLDPDQITAVPLDIDVSSKK